MSVLRFFRALLGFRESTSSEAYVDISESLAEELDELDREDPNWDRPARLATAIGALRRGVSLELVEGVYGGAICAEAQRILRNESNKPEGKTRPSYVR